MLKKLSPFQFGLAHISLALIGLMWVLPFLYYYHAYPITTFYQEWGAGMLGVGAMTLLLTARYWQAPEVPRIVLLPIGLMLLLVVQFVTGGINHFDRVMMLALYFLFAALLMMVGQRLRVELGLPAVVTVLAVFLLFGAELNTLAGILQHYRWNVGLNHFITAKTGLAIFGNTAQPNHYANYLALGMISLGLLYVRFSLRIWQVVLLVAPMLFVMTLSGSRSSWLYLLFAVGLSYLWQRRDQTLRPLFYYSLGLLLGFGLMHFVVQIPWLEAVTGGTQTSAERVLNDNTSSQIRLHLWHEAILIFAHFPLLGAGFGQFAFQHLQLAAELRNTDVYGLYNNAHNLVLQIAAEGGLAGLAVLLGALGVWFWHSVVRAAQFTLFHWWGYAILAVLGIHSLLEYPLWYGYFIGIAAVMLGMFDAGVYRLELRNSGRLAVALMLVMGTLTLLQTFHGYQRLEFALIVGDRAAKDSSLVPLAREQLLAVNNYALLSSYAELFVANTIEPGQDHLKEKLRLNERALSFVPIASVSYNEAWLLAFADRMPEARSQLGNTIWAYPLEYPAAHGVLLDLVRKDPARFSGLLEFANQKYEEYRSAAIPAK